MLKESESVFSQDGLARDGHSPRGAKFYVPKTFHIDSQWPFKKGQRYRCTFSTVTGQVAFYPVNALGKEETPEPIKKRMVCSEEPIEQDLSALGAKR